MAKQTLILISAGHSNVPPRDPGACGNGFVEAEIALEMRDRVSGLLREKGLMVIEDGADGINEPLRKAILLAKKASCAVEFHLNASANRTASGVEVLSLPEHKKFSQEIALAISNVTGGRLRGEGGWLNQNAGNHHRLGFCVAGGLIVEFCFISNKKEIETFMAKRGEVARAVAQVIIERAKPLPKTYTVKSGDTVSAICKKFGLKMLEFYQLNNFTGDNFDPENIRPGDVFRISLR